MGRFVKGTSKYYKWSEEVTKYTLEGYSGADIALILNIDKSQVHKLRKHLGLTAPRNSKFTPENPLFEEKLNAKSYKLLSKDKKGSSKHPKYEVQCLDCGKISLKSGDLITRSKCQCHKLNKKASNFKGFELISMTHFSSIKEGAITRNLEFSITIEDIWKLFETQNKKCALSGLDLTMATNFLKTNIRNASLDRIDSTKGYILNNVQWVHKDINRMKVNFPNEYFIKMCKLISNNN